MATEGHVVQPGVDGAELQTQRVCTHCSCGNLYDVIVQSVENAATVVDHTETTSTVAEVVSECVDVVDVVNVVGANHKISPATTSHTAAALIAGNLGNEDTFFHWSKGTIRLLLTQYRKHQDLFFSPNIKKRKAWEVVAASICEKGIVVTWQQCESKWKNLQRNFRKIKNDMLTIGSTTSRWPYYKDMEAITGMRLDEEDDGPLMDNDLSSVARTASSSLTLDGPVGALTTNASSGLLDQSNGVLGGPDSVGSSHRAKKRKITPEEEPAWFRTYRMEVQRRHEQRMAIQRQIMEQHKLLTRQLIKVLECFKK